MKRKFNFFLAFVLIVIATGTINAQLTPLAKKLYAGDILFTAENNTVEKQKELKDVKVFTPQQAIYATCYVNVKIKSHQLFKKYGSQVSLKLTLKVKGGDSTKMEFDLKPEVNDKKFACFELVPATLAPENKYHQHLASMFGGLKPGVYTVSLSTDADNVLYGKFDLDLSGGTGKYGELNKKLKEEEEKRLAEIKKKKEEAKKKEEEEAKKIDAAIKAFKSSKDIVKVAFKNTCADLGTISVSTGDNYTSFSVNVKGNGQSDQVICRPENKIYQGANLIHTVAATSKNKVIEFCAPKVEAPVVYNVGDYVQVWARGVWSAGTIIEVSNEVSGGSYKIHYDGSSDTHDEWWGPANLRK